MRKFLAIAFGSVLGLAMAACSPPDVPVPVIDEVPTSTQPGISTATPDIYSTSVARTLSALAAAATSAETAAPTDTPTPKATDTPQPLGFIRSFDIIPLTIDPGDSITLTWSAEGETATIYTVLQTGQLSTFYEVDLSGSLTLSTSDTVRNSVTFMLAVARGDQTDMRTVSAVVRCPDVWYFVPSPDGCPRSAPLETAAAFQPFEHGSLIWLALTGQIYVLFDDSGYPPVRVAEDKWQEGMPEYDPAIVPPAGYFQPERGFGLLWRGETMASYAVRDRLGWATAPEIGFTSRLQCDSAAKYNTCYLLDHEDNVIVLEPENSGWHYWDGKK